VVAPIITAPERASFRRCRRQWDFSAGLRRNLEPAAGGAALDLGQPDLDRAVRDALAIYYYPGMWDWDRSVRLPLVTQELERALARQQAAGTEARQAVDEGRALLARYVAWAPGADRFAPVLVEADFEVIVPDPDPARPGSGLVTPDGAAVRYGGRIDLLAVDEHDAWTRHRPGDVAAAGQRLAADVTAMIQPDPDVSPEPSDRNCRPCPFLDPCLAERAGHDPAQLLRAHYQPREGGGAQPGRLGGRAWGMGRGAAPPGFQRRGPG